LLFPYRKFLPSIGRLSRYRPPLEIESPELTIRNDTGVREGDEISTFYDPMISKLCAWAPDRAGAIRGMARALEDLQIEGPGHNAPFLSAVMDQERFATGRLSTNYIPDEFPDGFHGLAPSPAQLDLMTAAACAMHRLLAARARFGGGALGPEAREEWDVIIGGSRRRVKLSDLSGRIAVEIVEDGRTLLLETIGWRPGQPMFRGRLDGIDFTITVTPAAEGFIIRHRAASARVLVLTPKSADLHQRLPAKTPPDTSRLIISPMPGLVVSMDVVEGEDVKEGQIICVIEAMKMQNIIRAERDGLIKSIGAKVGDSVAADDVIASFG